MNTEISISNISKKYRGCTTKLYRHWGTDADRLNYDRGNKIILSYNYQESIRVRKIEVIGMDDSVHCLQQSVGGKGGWSYNIIDWDFKAIRFMKMANSFMKKAI